METQILSKNLQIHSGQKKNKTGPPEKSAKNKNKNWKGVYYEIDM